MIVILVSTSCSFLRVGLRYFDWFLVREATKTFNLTDSQKATFRELILKNGVWIRKSWTPNIVDLLEKLEPRAELGLTASDLNAFVLTAKALRAELAQRVAIELASLSLSLTQEQLQHAAGAFSVRNERFTDLLKLTDDRLKTKRRTKLLDSVEDWFGDLSSSQEEDVCRIFGCDRLSIERSLEWATVSQKYFLEIISTSKEPAALASLLVQWSRSSLMPESKQKSWDAEQDAWIERIVALDQIMTPTQRRKSRLKIAEIREDLHWFGEH